MKERVISQVELKDSIEKSGKAMGVVGIAMLIGVLTARAFDTALLVPVFGVAAATAVRRWVHPGARFLSATLIIGTVWLTWWAAGLVSLERVAGPDHQRALRAGLVEGLLLYAPAIAAVFVTGAFVSVNHTQHLASQPSPET